MEKSGFRQNAWKKKFLLSQGATRSLREGKELLKSPNLFQRLSHSLYPFRAGSGDTSKVITAREFGIKANILSAFPQGSHCGQAHLIPELWIPGCDSSVKNATGKVFQQMEPKSLQDHTLLGLGGILNGILNGISPPTAQPAPSPGRRCLWKSGGQQILQGKAKSGRKNSLCKVLLEIHSLA